LAVAVATAGLAATGLGDHFGKFHFGRLAAEEKSAVGHVVDIAVLIGIVRERIGALCGGSITTRRQMEVLASLSAIPRPFCYAQIRRRAVRELLRYLHPVRNLHPGPSRVSLWAGQSARNPSAADAFLSVGGAP
jgi:hypothetical protein